MKEIQIADIINNIKNSDFFLNCAVPMGYVDALPILSVRNGKLCVLLPLLKYKVTGVVDKTLVYPVRFVVTYSISEKRAVGFTDLSYDEFYRKVDFDAPIGFFRHEEIQHLTKKEYKEKRDELYSMYDKVIGAITEGKSYTEEDEESFISLINVLLEPSLRPIYETIDKDFYEKYLS